MNPEAEDRRLTPHRWIIEPTYNARSFRLTTDGFCKHCGKTKRFPNRLDAPNEARRNPNDIEHGYRLMFKREFEDSQLTK